jgi:hypothetical protein
MRKYLDFVGSVGLFVLQAARRALAPPFEWQDPATNRNRGLEITATHSMFGRGSRSRSGYSRPVHPEPTGNWRIDAFGSTAGILQ